jgi:hypothetical protein
MHSTEGAIVERDIILKLGIRHARQSAKSMEFMRRNLERIAAHLPRDRHVRDVYRQLVYDSHIIYRSLHDLLEMACNEGTVSSIPFS